MQTRDDAQFPDEASPEAVSELIDRYLKHVLRHKRDRRNRERQLRRWSSKLGAVPVGDVSRALVT